MNDRTGSRKQSGGSGKNAVGASPAITRTEPAQHPKTGVPIEKPAKPPEVGVDLTASKAPGQLHMPNDRDEKVGMTGGVPSSTVQQATRDVKRGLQDTSRASEAGAAYEKLKR